MKYLEINIFDQINDIISCADAGDSKFCGRIEAYSCKFYNQNFANCIIEIIYIKSNFIGKS